MSTPLHPLRLQISPLSHCEKEQTKDETPNRPAQCLSFPTQAIPRLFFPKSWLLSNTETDFQRSQHIHKHNHHSPVWFQSPRHLQQPPFQPSLDCRTATFFFVKHGRCQKSRENQTKPNRLVVLVLLYPETWAERIRPTRSCWRKCRDSERETTENSVGRRTPTSAVKKQTQTSQTLFHRTSRRPTGQRRTYRPRHVFHPLLHL